MHPVLGQLELGDRVVTVGAYSTFMVLAWLVALGLGVGVSRLRGLSTWRVLVVLTASLALGLVGARLFDVLTVWGHYSVQPGRIVGLGFTGFSLYGGLVAALTAGALLARRLGLPLWRLADSIVPGLAAGIVLMRTGCLLHGCCFGKVTDLPWGIQYAVGSPAWEFQLVSGRTGVLGLAGAVEPVQPTQVYEMMAAAILAAMALWFSSRRDPTGQARHAEGLGFLTFALSFTLFRLGNGFLRESTLRAPLQGWFYPALYLAICAVIALFWWSRFRAGLPAPVPQEEDGRE